MRIDLHPKGVVVDGVVVALSRREQALVLRLMAHEGVPQSRETLLVEVWGYRAGARTRTVESTMSRLRARLEAAGVPLPIRSVRGRGWMLDDRPADDAPVLVGRAHERQAVARWLAGTGRLLTIAGPPGIGKSALAAACLGPDARRIAATDLGDAIDWLGAIEACPPGVVWLDDADALVDRLGAMLPNRRMVVTSRRPLHHRAEEVLRLGPLAAPEASALAVQLLDRWFPGAGRDRQDIERWADASEGNPLALELAIRERESPGPETSRTVIARVGRSQALLTPELRGALARLAAVPVPIPNALALVLAGSEEVLVALRERSLVLTEHPGGWRVPALVRAGLVDPVDASGPIAAWVVDRTSRAHRAGGAAWEAFVAEAASVLPLYEWVARTSDDAGAIWWATVTLEDHGNRRTGRGGPDRRPLLDRAVAAVGPEALLRRVREHRRHGDPAAAEADLDEAARTTDPSTANRVAALRSALVYNTGDMALARELSLAVLARSEQLGDSVREALVLAQLASIARWSGDHDTALAYARAATAVPVSEEWTLKLMGFAAACEADVGRDTVARQKLEECVRRAEASGWVALADIARCELGWTEVACGIGEGAVQRIADAVARLVACGATGTTERMDLARALVGTGEWEHGLRELRSVTHDLQATGAMVQAANGRAFAVAARVVLGLPPVAPWMPPESLDGDPHVTELVRGFEAFAVRDLGRVGAALEQTSTTTGRRARVLRRLLADLANRG